MLGKLIIKNQRRAILQAGNSIGSWTASTGVSSQMEQRRFNNSFMRSVQEQMRKEMEKNEDLKKAYEELQKSKKAGTPTFIDTAKQRLEHIKIKTSMLQDKLDEHTETIKFKFGEVKKENDRVIEENATLKQMSTGISNLAGSMKSVFGKAFEASQKAVSSLNEEERVAKEKAELWKQRKEEQLAKEQSEKKTTAEGEADETAGHHSASQSTEPDTSEYGLVLSHESTWDRFGAKLKDMPFLNKFFSTDGSFSLFKETEQAKALAKQKEIDPSFRLQEFAETIEHVICPRLVEAYLAADVKFMEAHLDKSAKIIFQSSVRDRRTQKVSFDETILRLTNVEMRGAQFSEDPEDDGKPVFVWTCTTQQINCLSNSAGEIVEGSLDDIREVVYAIAVRSHNNPTAENVEFPYEITEFAIVGAKPVLF